MYQLWPQMCPCMSAKYMITVVKQLKTYLSAPNKGHKAFLGRDENTSVFISYILIFFHCQPLNRIAQNVKITHQGVWGELLMNMEMKIITVSPASHPPGQRLFPSWLLRQMLHTGSLWAEKSHWYFLSSFKHF